MRRGRGPFSAGWSPLASAGEVGRRTAVDHSVELLVSRGLDPRFCAAWSCAPPAGRRAVCAQWALQLCLRRGRQTRNPDFRAVSLPTTVKQMFRKELKMFRKELLSAMVHAPWFGFIPCRSAPYHQGPTGELGGAV